MNSNLSLKVLKRNLEKLQESIDRISDAILVLDNEMSVVFANKFAKEIFEQDNTKFINENLFLLVPPLSESSFFRAIFEAKNTGEFTYVEEYLSFCKKYLLFRIYPSESGLSIVIQDVTKIKKTENELLMSEKRYQVLVERMPIGILITDMSQNTIYVNNKFIQLTQYRLDDIPSINEWWIKAYPDENYRESLKTKWNYLVDEAFALKKEILPIESKVRCKNGFDKYLDISFFTDGDYGVVTFVDVSNRKDAEKVIAESEFKYRTITENMTDLIWTMDKSLKINYLSPSVEQIIGYKVEEFIKMPIEKSISDSSKERVEKILEELLFSIQNGVNKEKVWEFEAEILNKNKQKIWTLSKVKLLLDEKENIIGIIGATTDVSELKTNNQKLEEQNAELRRWSEATLGRELRIIELKKEVNVLLESLKRSKKYNVCEKETGI